MRPCAALGSADASAGVTELQLAHQGQAYAMMMAGYESTANALAFTLYLLTLNRHKEASIIAEVLAFGSAIPSYADLARYSGVAHAHALRVCIQHSLQWYGCCRQTRLGGGL